MGRQRPRPRRRRARRRRPATATSSGTSSSADRERWPSSTPTHEGQGIGTRLLEWAEARDRDRGRRPLPAVDGGGQRARADAADRRRLFGRAQLLADGVLARRRAARPRRRRRASRCAPSTSPATLSPCTLWTPPASAAARTTSPRRCGSSARSTSRPTTSTPRSAASPSATATIAGFLLARRFAEDAVGYVDIFAVDPRHQRRGVGTALLASAFAAFAAAGLREAQLGVASDNPRGTARLRARGDDGPVSVRHLRAPGGVNDLRGRRAAAQPLAVLP